MATVELYEVTQRPGDVLYVRGAVDGLVVEATGWVSALENHYPAEAYDVLDGGLLKDAAPRPMTEAEARAYCEGLLLEAAGPPVEPTLPVAVALDPEPPAPDPEPDAA